MTAQNMIVSDPNDNLNVILIGNNPSELSGYLSKLSNFQGVRFITSFRFNLMKSLMEIRKWKPHYIVIDDYFPTRQIRKFVKRIRRNVETQEIPVAILKSNNRHLPVTGVQDFLLKENFSAERLFNAIRNSRNIRKAQIILYKTCKRSRKHILKFRKSVNTLI